jgi:hypothetical protein
VREKAKFVMVDDDYSFVLGDGTVIEKDMIGWIAETYGNYPEDCFYNKFSLDEAIFVANNNIECEIEMMDEFTNPELYEDTPLYEGERKLKLYKGKIIIHFL